MLKRRTIALALAAAAVGLGLATPAKAAEAGPIQLAMADYASTKAGDDAANRIAAKLETYKAHATKHAEHEHAKTDCSGCAECTDCADCKDCTKCTGCDSGKTAKGGARDPTHHGKAATDGSSVRAVTHA